MQCQLIATVWIYTGLHYVIHSVGFMRAHGPRGHMTRPDIMKYKGLSRLSGQACNCTLSRKLTHPQLFSAPLLEHIPKIQTTKPDSISQSLLVKKKSVYIVVPNVNSIWCEKTFFSSSWEGDHLSCLSCCNVEKNNNKWGNKIRIAWSNECAGMRRNYTDHDWDSLWEILQTDLAGTD